MTKKHTEGDPKKLKRSKHRVIAGVCGGIAEYLKIDPTVVRVLWAVIAVFGLGSGLLAYLLCWLLIPE
jgi:phage shock protein C